MVGAYVPLVGGGGHDHGGGAGGGLHVGEHLAPTLHSYTCKRVSTYTETLIHTHVQFGSRCLPAAAVAALAAGAAPAVAAAARHPP